MKADSKVGSLNGDGTTEKKKRMQKQSTLRLCTNKIRQGTGVVLYVAGGCRQAADNKHIETEFKYAA